MAQLTRKTGVKSASIKQDNTRHPFSAMPATREVEGSQTYRARTMGESGVGRVRVPDTKVAQTHRRNHRLDGSGHFPQ